MKVLFATDGSAAAKASAQLLLSVADPDRVEVTVLSVEAPVVSGDSRPARVIAEEAAGDFAKHGFRVEVRTARGHPGRAISQVAGEGFDLTVVGSGSTSWLGRALLGSVSGYLLRESPTPVLVRSLPSGRRPGQRLKGAIL
jgi:nucleotide-binding universal stress UspA family protein